MFFTNPKFVLRLNFKSKYASNSLFYEQIGKFARAEDFVDSVTERVKAPFLWRPCDHNCVVYVLLSPSSHSSCCVLR